MTMDWLPLWVYIGGYLWFWRYHVGAVLSTVYGDVDGEDFAFSLMFGTIAAFAWPLTVSGRVVYILWQKSVTDDVGTLSNFFPAPKEIETRTQKQKRIARENLAELEKRRQEINDHERENGLELTRWRNE